MSGIYRVLVGMTGCAMLLAVLTGQTLAAKVTIDNFSDPSAEYLVQSTSADSIPPSKTGSQGTTAVPLSGVIGGIRTGEITSFVSGGESPTLDLLVTGGEFSFDLFNATGSAVLRYNAGGDGLGENWASNTYFQITIASADLGAPVLTIGVIDADGNEASYEQTGLPLGDARFDFASFLGDTVSWSAIREVSLTIDSSTASTDVVLTDFHTAPEPSTLVLFALGAAAFFGTAHFRKRTRKSLPQS